MGDYRTIDGLGNNLIDDDWGSTNQAFLRLTPVAYGDGISSPSGEDRPSARQISNVIFDQDEPNPNAQGASDLFWLWGQFLDHDITLTPTSHHEFPIQIPIGDSYFDPFGTGLATMPLERSAFVVGSGETTPGQQFNEITAFIDASNVYGADATRAAFLRAADGKLKVSYDDYMPYNDGSMENAGGDSTNLYVAGDVRGNENVGLTSLHTVFVREHNRLVDEIKAQHPEYNAETLYQEAKLIVEAQMQVITYQEFLPILLGANAIPDYSGYQVNVDPQIANVFATAAYRLGHTMLSSQLLRVDEAGNEIEAGHLSLRDAFFRPDKILSGGGIDPILRGAAMQVAESLDTTVVDDVRNFLFGPPGAGGLDLAALNIQRGRDHGLADYNSARVAYGLDAVTEFSDITSQVELQQQLQTLYGNVNNIDVFVGGLAEDPQDGSMLGELFHTVVADQFIRLRDGDRFYYENRLSDEQITEVENTTLSDIIKRNTDIEHLQDQVMMAYDRMNGSKTHDSLIGNDNNNMMMADNGHDSLYGGEGHDEIYGGRGYDRLYGENGNDILHGEQGRDSIKAGYGDDVLYGGSGRDYLFGEAGNDHIYGGTGKDYLFGGYGDDVLVGGSGKDTLTGGYGNDEFVITLGTGKDVIQDFHRSTDPNQQDKINLKQVALTLDDVLMTQHGHDTHIHLPENDVVIVKNILPPLLTEADFII